MRSTSGALIAGRASPCSPLPTLQVPAETVLASSPYSGCFFRYFVIFTETSIRTCKNISVWKIIMYEPTISRWIARLLSLWPWLLKFESITYFFVFVILFFCSSVKICTIMDDDWSVVRAIETSVLYTYIVLLALLLLCVAIIVFLFLLRWHRVRFHNRVPGPDRLQLLCFTLHRGGGIRGGRRTK